MEAEMDAEPSPEVEAIALESSPIRPWGVV
jgi:hypothetical protein